MKKHIALLSLLFLGASIFTQQNKIAYFEKIAVGTEGGTTGPVLKKCNIECRNGKCTANCSFAMENQQQLMSQGYKLMKEGAAKAHIAQKTK